MGNMSYCRFQNTLSDMMDCLDHASDKLEGREERARKRMLQVARELVEELEYIYDDFEESLEKFRNEPTSAA